MSKTKGYWPQDITALRAGSRIAALQGACAKNLRSLPAKGTNYAAAALHGTSLKGASLYCTTQPCIICAKMIINAGIKEIVIKRGYPDKMAREFLREAKVRVRLAK